MDKIVEIARFTYPADAQPLMALLRSEGIECYTILLSVRRLFNDVAKVS